MLEEISDYRSISIIGLEKNVGKTTTLNYIIGKTRDKTLGLTSIGRDGESVDRVTSTEKPKIYIQKNTIIATSKGCLKNSDITQEILETTGMNTPMGEIIIVKALSDGFVELAGPSMNSEIETVIEKMKFFGAEQVLIDGALSRKSLASPSVADATIISTGAAVTSNYRKLIQSTAHTYNLLTLNKIEDSALLKTMEKNPAKIILIDDEENIKSFQVASSMNLSNEIISQLDENTRFFVIKGAITDKMIGEIIRQTNSKMSFTLVVEDGTKIFISEENLMKLKLKKIRLRVLHKINVVAITVNPTSPRGDILDSKKVIEGLKNYIPISVYDVKGVLN